MTFDVCQMSMILDLSHIPFDVCYVSMVLMSATRLAWCVTWYWAGVGTQLLSIALPEHS